MIDVRRAADRFTTATEGVVARHSFSFGAHYDPANVAFGALLAHNDETLAPGHGYDTHPHAGVDIVTWVVTGAVRHQDTVAGGAVLGPGTVQRLSAGRGVRHAEHAEHRDGPTRFVQMWLRADDPDAEPSCERASAGSHEGLVPLASGVPGIRAPLRLGTAGAVLHRALLGDGEAVLLPEAPRLHVYVARGAAELAGAGRLEEGDAARVTDESPLLTGFTTEVLVWQLP